MTRRGSFVAAVLAVLVVGLPTPAHAAGQTFTVTSTADSGVGTLRQAILDADGNGDATAVDTIAFDFRTGNGPFTIQLSTDLPPITEAVKIDGYTQGVATPGTPGDDARRNDQTVGTNAVIKVVLESLGALETGFAVDSPNVTIEGIDLPDWATGIAVDAVSHVKIAGDFIGTDPTGSSAGSSASGVAVNCPSRDVTIGGGALADRNLLSGNANVAVVVIGSRPCRGVTISGNLIGAAADANVRVGIPNNVGVAVATGRAADSVLVTRNLLIHNTRAAVDVLAPSNGVRILTNEIDRNGLGIDLNDDGVTPNDPSDADGGANHLQNFPVITSIGRTDPHHVVHGVLHSRPDRRYLLQFFAGAVPNPSGFGEGAVFIGQFFVQTDGNGRAAFAHAFTLGIDSWVTATATDTGLGDTSEFSKAVQVP